MSKNKNNNSRSGKGRDTNKNGGYKNNYKYQKGQRDNYVDKSSPDSKTDNDVSWYASHPQLLIDAASHAYGLPLGAKYSYNENIDLSENVDVAKYHHVPGIMSLGFVPSVGISVDANSPINVIARNMYSFVVHANSRNTRYNAPDLMMYLLAVDSLHMLHAWLTRAYGFMNFSTPLNRYLVKSLIESMGFNYDNLSGNMADFRGVINSLGVKLGALAIPDSIPYFKRHRWMVSNVWLDTPNTKAQMYFYSPDSFFQYEEMYDEEQSGHAKHEWGNLNYRSSGSGSHNISTIKTLINDLYNPVIESEDCNIIAGDILKAFGGERLLIVPQIPTDFTLSPSYNEEVLTQIHNYRGMGVLETKYAAVDQDVDRNIVVHNPTFRASVVGTDMNVVFDMPYDNPTPADTMVASRMTVISDPINDGAFYENFHLSSCGSEIPTSAKMWFYRWDPGAEASSLVYETLAGDMKISMLLGTDQPSSLVAADQMNKVRTICHLTNFNMHPLVRVWAEKGQTDKEFELIATHGDITNFTVMNAADLRKMHDIALLSEYSVPAMGQAFQLR